MQSLSDRYLSPKINPNPLGLQGPESEYGKITSRACIVILGRLSPHSLLNVSRLYLIDNIRFDYHVLHLLVKTFFSLTKPIPKQLEVRPHNN